VAEILKQLNLEERLLRNSVGILTFHPEFLETGVVKAVSEALPFDSVGGMTNNAAVPGVTGEWEEPVLAVTVLTSDDVLFRAGVSDAIENDPQAPTRELYSRLAPPSAGKPSLLLMFAPVLDKIGGDDFIEALDASSGGTPVFGTLVSSYHQLEIEGLAVCWNGCCHTNALVLVAMFGDVEPKFVMSFIPDERLLRPRSIITMAERNQIQEINGLVPVKYLEAIGLVENNSTATVDMGTFPVVLTLGDGSRVVRSVYRATEEGYALSFGTIPQGARIGFSDVDGDFVLQSAKETTARIAAAAGARSALIFSCIGRQWPLGARMYMEIKELAESLNDSLVYHFAYSQGEICPVRNQNGQLVNRFHNFSIIACLL
jgi:small ligand-binding sensory domain FIST